MSTPYLVKPTKTLNQNLLNGIASDLMALTIKFSQLIMLVRLLSMQVVLTVKFLQIFPMRLKMPVFYLLWLSHLTIVQIMVIIVNVSLLTQIPLHLHIPDCLSSSVPF